MTINLVAIDHCLGVCRRHSGGRSLAPGGLVGSAVTAGGGSAGLRRMMSAPATHYLLIRVVKLWEPVVL